MFLRNPYRLVSFCTYLNEENGQRWFLRSSLVMLISIFCAHAGVKITLDSWHKHYVLFKLVFMFLIIQCCVVAKSGILNSKMLKENHL